MARTIERYATTEQVAEFLNKPLSWVHNNAGPRGIPRYKIGNHWRFKLSEVAGWVEAQSG
jgi:excisionase family DNA binding protein